MDMGPASFRHPVHPYIKHIDVYSAFSLSIFVHDIVQQALNEFNLLSPRCIQIVFRYDRLGLLKWICILRQSMTNYLKIANIKVITKCASAKIWRTIQNSKATYCLKFIKTISENELPSKRNVDQRLVSAPPKIMSIHKIKRPENRKESRAIMMSVLYLLMEPHCYMHVH